MTGVRFFCLFSVIVSNPVWANGSDYYQAFDHHPEKDRSYFAKISGNLESETTIDSEKIKETVSSAYGAQCHRLVNPNQQEECQDLVRVMIYPEQELKTDFGRNIYSILVEGNFDSANGRAIAQALSLDPTSLHATRLFYEMKTGHLDLRLLRWFRFYATLPKELNFYGELHQLFPEDSVILINKEIAASFQDLAAAYVEFAQNLVTYFDYFRAYRRHFQAIYLRETLEQIVRDYREKKQRRQYDAIYNRGLLRISNHTPVNMAMLPRLLPVMEWLQTPTKIVTAWKKLNLHHEPLDESEIKAVRKFQLYESNNLIAHWAHSPRGAFALLILYEQGFPEFGLHNEESQMRYFIEASKLRSNNSWKDLNLAGIFLRNYFAEMATDH